MNVTIYSTCSIQTTLLSLLSQMLTNSVSHIYNNNHKQRQGITPALPPLKDYKTEIHFTVQCTCKPQYVECKSEKSKPMQYDHIG